MNRFLILLTMLLTPLLALGQSTAVLDGIGLANGKSYTNYIKNPNAQKNVSNVTAVSGSTITRVAGATALYQGTEFSIDDTNAWGAEWSAMALNPGLKNRLCEVQILAKSDAADAATLEVLQNSVAVFTQSLTLDASNPKRFGGTFPCGDLTYTSSVKLSGTSNPGAVKVAAVYLGEPVSVSSGGVVTEWQSYTAASFGGQGTLSITQNELKWRREGPNLWIQGKITIGAGTGTADTFTFPFPESLTLAGITKVGGIADWYDASTADLIGLSIQSVASSNLFYFVQSMDKTGVTALQANEFGSGDEVTFTAGPFPISGWAATDIVTPEASIRSEISANAASVTATYPNTATIASITLTPGSWLVHGEDVVYSSVAPAAGSTAASGSDLYDGSSVILDSKYSAQVSNAVVGGDTNLFKVQNTTYVTVAAGTTKTISFRLRSDALSGTPTGAAFTSRGYGKLFAIPYNTAGTQSFYLQGPTKGGNSGNAIPTGYVGEKISGTISSSTSISTAYSDLSSITLSPGTWSIVYSATAELTTGASVGNYSDLSLRITNSSDVLLQNSGRTIRCATQTANTNTTIQAISAQEVVSISSSTTYKLRAIRTDNSGTGTANIYNSGNNLYSVFYAVRLD